MRLGRLIDKIEGARVTGDPDADIGSICYDSRRAGPGSLFFAIRGEKADGTRFIPAAVELGASVVAFEEYGGERPSSVTFVAVPDARVAMARAAAEFYGRPSERLRLVGITGTNGKTTTSYLVKKALEAAGHETGLIGTISYTFGGKTLPAPNTTPESVDLQRLLAEMADAGAAYAVIEVSSHAVSLKRIAGSRFAVKVFTNFTQDHLDFHGDMGSYYAAKKELFTAYAGANVVNIDDPMGEDIAASATGDVLTYGIREKADITASGIGIGPGGIRFTVTAPPGEVEMSTPLVGRHNVYNILAATGACIKLGMGLSDIAHGIASMREVPGRLEKVDAGQEFTVLVDYAHTEDALERAAAAAREFTAGRVITVFGCGGDRDRSKRPRMGRAAARLSDIVVLTSDNPRTEDPAEIIRQAEAGITAEGSKEKGKGYFVFEDRAEAIGFAISVARKGDTVLIAGKGHEDYQIVGETKYHFDDRLVARQAISAL
jgi:UDP-N-acetylmuramoyl-L-alanyl-D-glutamate--2,6-diaminopimelate ligase